MKEREGRKAERREVPDLSEHGCGEVGVGGWWAGERSGGRGGELLHEYASLLRQVSSRFTA